MSARLVGWVAALGLMWPAPAFAATCSIGSALPVGFGAYNVFSGTSLDSAGSVTYRCDDVELGDTILIQLSRGSSSSYQPRTLLNGLVPLEYNLYLDPARTSVWGDGSSGTSQYGPITPLEATDTTLNIYGRIPSRQNAVAGSYSDTITITIVF